MTMPNFLIIGANKAGTSSLYHYLNQHPQVYMSPIKEPMFFSQDGQEGEKTRRSSQDATMENVVDNLEAYQSLFQGVTTETAIGEASTSYLHCPWSAESIKSHIPDVKFIVVLRDCADRAYSNYSMYAQWGIEKLDFEQAVEEEDNRIQNGSPMGQHYVRLGFYYDLVKHYIDVFGRDQILICLYEDLKADSLGLCQDIFRFLDIQLPARKQ